MPRTVFYLLRHAATVWNQTKRIQGQWDSELTPEGVRAAETLAAGLAGLSLKRILVSDLGRARSTAGILNLRLKLPVSLERRLREQHFGDWTGKYWRDIPPEDIAAQEARGWDFRPPGGESRREVALRAGAALADASRAYGARDILVVTHNGVMKAVLYELLGRAYLPDEPPAFDPTRPQAVVCDNGKLDLLSLDVAV